MNQISNSYRLKDGLLAFLEAKHKSDPAFVNELTHLLSLSSSTVYRRLSGEKPFTHPELFLLANHYQISLDQFLSHRDKVLLFDFPNLHNPVKSFKDYLQPIENDLKELQPRTNARLDYISREIPIFHYFFFPELTAFKAFIWGGTMWEFPSFKNKTKFSLKDIKGIHSYRQSIISIYMQLPSVEIWGINNLDVTLNQIYYYLSNSMFEEPKEALILCDQLQQLIDHINNMVNNGKKFMIGDTPDTNSPDYNLYHSVMAPSNNFVIAQSDEFRKVYTTLDNLNTLSAQDEDFFEYVQQWRTKLIQHSDEITPKSVKNRARFFNDSNEKLKKFKAKVQHYVEERD